MIIYLPEYTPFARLYPALHLVGIVWASGAYSDSSETILRELSKLYPGVVQSEKLILAVTSAHSTQGHVGYYVFDQKFHMCIK